MPLSWNEIRNRAHEFSKRWENETSEDAAQTVLDTPAQFILPLFSNRERVVVRRTSLADLNDPLAMPPTLVKIT